MLHSALVQTDGHNMSEAPEQSAPLLRLERVRVEFGRLVAVHDVSFELAGACLLGLIGPNGAGKTTLLRAIAGLQPLACGRVAVTGEDLNPQAYHLKRLVGFTPDTPPVYEGLTVREFLKFIGKAYDLDRSELDDRIAFWLDQVWLTEKADQKLKTLSRGMRQRIGIARTMLPNPQVILLDEPAAGLDPAGRVQFRQLLCNLRQQGKALIVSSHILADMNEYCSHIAIMAQGRILQFGTVTEVAAGSDGERCRYSMLLAEHVAGLADLLADIPDVAAVAVNGERVTIEYSQDRQKVAALIAQLVKRNVPIAAFWPHRADLEEAYLRTGIRQVD